MWPFKRKPKPVWDGQHTLDRILEVPDAQGGLQSAWTWYCSCTMINTVGSMLEQRVYDDYDLHLERMSKIAARR